MASDNTTRMTSRDTRGPFRSRWRMCIQRTGAGLRSSSDWGPVVFGGFRGASSPLRILVACHVSVLEVARPGSAAARRRQAFGSHRAHFVDEHPWGLPSPLFRDGDGTSLGPYQ